MAGVQWCRLSYNLLYNGCITDDMKTWLKENYRGYRRFKAVLDVAVETYHERKDRMGEPFIGELRLAS